MERLRILIADDDRDCAGALAALCESHRYTVREAYDGPYALKIANELRPHVAVLDLGMPSIDGYEVCRRIRSFPWARDTLLIALSGRGQFADRVLSQDSGFDYHITKPISFDQVLALIERSNNRLHSQAALARSIR